MARDSKYDVLFEPISIGPKVMRNRFYQVAHCNGAGSDRPGFQAHFRAMKAEGGWAAVSTEYCSIAPESDDTHRVSARLWDEGDVRNLSLMCELLHSHDALAAVEIWHGGPNAAGQDSRVPARGPSQIPSAMEFMRSCKAMDLDDIRQVQRLYVDAIKRARDAGFDIITIYCAHTEALPHQFLLPFFNKRTDQYGGSFENRARFTRELLQLAKEAVGDECAISLRFGIDTLFVIPDHLGVKPDGDGWRFIEHLDDLVDLWDINVAEATEWGEDAAPSRTHAENHEKPYVDQVKQHTDKPVVNVGRFTNPDTMVQVIRDGQCDIIGAARPSIADPFLPKKIEEGRLEDIRECIGCNVCISRWEIGGPPLICTQNATSGEEYRRGWHPERFSRAANSENDVLVVGAGPAGMECAMVLAKRGMRRIHLVEADTEIGGCMRFIPTLPGLGEWARVVNYRRIQLDKLRNVEVIPRKRLDAEAVRDYGAEIVIVATGARWEGDGMNGVTHDLIEGAGADQPHVLTPDQVFEGKPYGKRVVVYDTDGYFMGVSMAEKLAREGSEVTYVTPFEAIGPYTHYTLENPRLNRTLRAIGVEVASGRVLTEIQAGSVTLVDAWTEEAEQRESDSVLLVTQRVSTDALYHELKADPDALTSAGIASVFRIGDCEVPQIVADAIFSGHRLAREIDSPDPAVPLPYIRERRLLNATESDYELGSLAIAGATASDPPAAALASGATAGGGVDD
jgi:dimethylamine/trimethylamine dehydrogenase